MLLALKDDYIFSLTAPAKLQAYMAAAKPVVAMIDGEARNLIADSNCGVSHRQRIIKAWQKIF